MLFPATRITAAQTAILATRLERRARALIDGGEGFAPELREIEAALMRVKAGQYGLCTDCGAPLPLALLGAMPHTRYCVLCEQAHASRPPTSH